MAKKITFATQARCYAATSPVWAVARIDKFLQQNIIADNTG